MTRRIVFVLRRILFIVHFWVPHIEFPGAQALAKALRANSVLESLKLSGNTIGDTGAAALFKSLIGVSKGFLSQLWLSRYIEIHKGRFSPLTT